VREGTVRFLARCVAKAIQGTDRVNDGTSTAAGATVNFGGSFTTAALGNFSGTGAAVTLTGTLNNAGTTLARSPAVPTGGWKVGRLPVGPSPIVITLNLLQIFLRN
jgi:hypothetical protein